MNDTDTVQSAISITVTSVFVIAFILVPDHCTTLYRYFLERNTLNFGGVFVMHSKFLVAFCVGTLLFLFFCRYRGFCHRTESDLVSSLSLTVHLICIRLSYVIGVFLQYHICSYTIRPFIIYQQSLKEFTQHKIVDYMYLAAVNKSYQKLSAYSSCCGFDVDHFMFYNRIKYRKVNS